MTKNPDDQWKEKYENKLKALQRKIQYEKQTGQRRKHFQFQGGILQYHQWITLVTGSMLFLAGITLQQGAWIYFYLLGLTKIIKDTVSNLIDKKRNNTLQPLLYYLIGALLVSIIMFQAGYKIPDMHLGLISNFLELI
ncbi:hypothetical protein OSG_eHP23_00095 [environmental Halophage eHP-23]|nr:hypothetical protein OSG_eHP23_00095 [environmental Halophage eHP-23]